MAAVAMDRDRDWIVPLSATVFAALFIGTIAYDEIGMTAEAIRIDALRPRAFSPPRSLHRCSSAESERGGPFRDRPRRRASEGV
jgi:hypothetical protein